MKSFKIFVYKNERYRILITDYSESEYKNNSLYSTFDEKIQFAEHDQLTLTFSLVKYIDRIDQIGNQLSTNKKRLENHYHKLLQIGSKIELVLDNKDKYIFIVSGIKPTVSKSNVKFEYTCQDEVSYCWSRRNIGLSYSTMTHGGVQNIYDITQTVLKEAKILYWRTTQNENTEIDNFLSNKKITLEVENSNPYNIIIEACNALNAYMKINWTHRTISFYQKDRVKFSGYRYRPQTNLKSMGVDFNMNDMSTIMHVYGGIDENEQIVSLVPSLPKAIQKWWSENYSQYKNVRINYDDFNENDETLGLSEKEIISIKEFKEIAKRNPSLGNFLYNFDFFSDNGLLSQKDKDEMLNILEIKMAYNNMWLKYLEPTYWRSYSMLYLYITEAKAILDNLQATRLSENITLDENTSENVLKLKSDFADKMSTISNTICSLYNRNVCVNSLDNISSSSYKMFTIDLLQDLVTEYKIFLDSLDEARKNKEIDLSTITDEYEKSLKTAEKDYYTNRYHTLLTLCGSGWHKPFYMVENENSKEAEGEAINHFKATYPTLIEELYNILINTSSESNTIYDYVNKFSIANDTLWTNLYSKYNQFIYESKYEDSDELDSVSLFNKAISYYQDYNKPNANYSISILDLGSLELIDIPRLAVGSKIKVYNEELNLNEEHLVNGELYTPLNNIQFTNNDLIVSQLSYSLRKSGDVTISVEKISSYQSILQKLISSVN